MATSLREAVMDGKLDGSHPLAKKWIAKRPQRGPRSGRPNVNDTAGGGPETLSVREKLAEVAILEAKVARDDGRLISRALVQHHVFGLVDATFKRLVGDLPATATSRLASAIRAGATREEQVSLMRSMVSTELGSLKRRAIRALRQSDATGQLDPCRDVHDEHDGRETTRLREFAEALRADEAGRIEAERAARCRDHLRHYDGNSWIEQMNTARVLRRRNG